MKQLFLLLAAAFLFHSCGDDSDALALTFKMEYDEVPLVMFEEYTAPTGESIEFSRISFFISDLNFTLEDGTVFTKEVDYIDLTESHANEELAKEGYLYELTESESNASSVSFNIGLTPEQNATRPIDYPSSNALSDSGEYWSGWESYVMIKVEGLIDADGDGMRERGVSLHLGTDQVTRSFNYNVNEKNVDFVLDIESLFDCQQSYNIVETPMIHSLGQSDQMMVLADNLSCALSQE